MTVGIDLGEVNIAAVVAENGQGVVITRRHLRSVKRLRNKRHAAYTKRLTRCTPGSRRTRRLLKRNAQASARCERQARDILHKASRQVVGFVQQQGVAHLAVGDVRAIAEGTTKGRRQNQRMSQWAHGQFVQYVTYKSRAVGMKTTYIPEDYSTRTCSVWPALFFLTTRAGLSVPEPWLWCGALA